MSSFKTLTTYTIAITFLLTWWIVAFQSDYHEPIAEMPVSVSIPRPEAEDLLKTLDRNQILAALNGNLELMNQLLLEWDLDAQILSSQQKSPIQRLTAKQLLRAQIILRELQVTPRKDSQKRFLPQTFLAASYLLALAHPEEIAALPKGLRDLTQLYPKSLTDTVPLDINRYHSERLFLAKPDIAFVANYSDPATLDALRSQHIPLVAIQAPTTLSEIAETLKEIGRITGHAQEAELLNLFIEGCFCAIDNRIAHLTSQFDPSKRLKIAFLDYHSQFSIPGAQTLTAQLLQRLKLVEWPHEAIDGRKDPWLIPIESEQIVNLKPDALIISTANIEGLYQALRREKAFHSYFIPKRRLFLVDSAIQESPTQYIVLAYLDLYQALKATLTP